MDINEFKDKKGKGSGKKDALLSQGQVSLFCMITSHMPQVLWLSVVKEVELNWGNSTKKEEFLALPEFSQLQIDAMRKNGIEVEVVDEVRSVGMVMRRRVPKDVW